MDPSNFIADLPVQFPPEGLPESFAQVVIALVLCGLTFTVPAFTAYTHAARRRKQREVQLAFCEARGWRYSGRSGKRLFRIESDLAGIPWELICRRRAATRPNPPRYCS